MYLGFRLYFNVDLSNETTNISSEFAGVIYYQLTPELTTSFANAAAFGEKASNMLPGSTFLRTNLDSFRPHLFFPNYSNSTDSANLQNDRFFGVHHKHPDTTTNTSSASLWRHIPQVCISDSDFNARVDYAQSNAAAVNHQQHLSKVCLDAQNGYWRVSLPHGWANTHPSNVPSPSRHEVFLSTEYVDITNFWRLVNSANTDPFTLLANTTARR
jgi:hypothetical protein